MTSRSYLISMTILVLVGVVGLLFPTQAARASEGLNLEVEGVEAPPKLFGLSGGDWRAYVPDLARATGRGPAFQGMFWTFDDYPWPNPWAVPALDDVVAGGAVPFIEITTAQFDEFVDRGSSQLDALVGTVAEWTSRAPQNRVLIAPFPEANLAAHPWGKDRSAFITGYERVVDAFATAGVGPDKVRFVFALNGGIPNPLTWADYYPGDDLVDIVGFSKLNRNDPWRAYAESFGRHIAEIRQDLTTTKPILAFQTGSVEEDGDRSQWLRDMFRNLRTEEQVLGAIYLNVEKVEGGKYNDYRILADGQVDPVVVAEYPTWTQPSEAAWIFDGRMDDWEQARIAELEKLGGFVDVEDSVFVDEIALIAEMGITRGCNPPVNDRFCPDDPVTRGQMAAFLVRALGYSAGGGVDFVDDDGSVFEADIEKLAAAGVTRGCNPPVNDRFCPDDPVTRGQMAAFLVRALGYSAGGGVDFVDDDGSVFEADIEKLAAAGVTRGCNPPVNDRFCPDDAVTRGQMAAFLVRAIRS